MPIYTYQCDDCQRPHDDFRNMDDRDTPGTCPDCGGNAPKVFNPGGARGMVREYDKPIEMYSVALGSKAEIREFQKRNPGVDISTNRRDPLYGVPIARTRQQKTSILQNEGFAELN